MQETNLKTINHDVETLISDTQPVIQATAARTGEKIAEVGRRSARLLSATLTKAQEAQTTVLATSKEIAASADGFVKNKPWRAVAAATGAGMLLGVLLGSKKSR